MALNIKGWWPFEHPEIYYERIEDKSVRACEQQSEKMESPPHRFLKPILKEKQADKQDKADILRRLWFLG